LDSSSSYETKDAHQCRNQHSFTKKHFLGTSFRVYTWAGALHPSQLWSCLRMIAVQTGSIAGLHCIMCVPGISWPHLGNAQTGYIWFQGFIQVYRNQCLVIFIW
jgi:hypothetical protein